MGELFDDAELVSQLSDAVRKLRFARDECRLRLSRMRDRVNGLADSIPRCVSWQDIGTYCMYIHT